MTIPLLRPSCTQAEIDAVTDVLKSGWWGQGPKCEEFEQRIARRHGYAYAVTTNSATAALHLSCIVAGVAYNRKAITPALTFVSTALAPTYEGTTAGVLFADVDPGDLCIDWNHVQQIISESEAGTIAAVIPVDYAGYPSRPDQVTIDRLHGQGITIIQDAAHYAGGTEMYGDLVCLSFHPVKNLATGDGGAILTNNPEWYERLKALRWCGINKSTHERTVTAGYGWDYDIQEVGYKYNWNDIQAAIGLVQLARLDELNGRRAEIAALYDKLLAGVDYVQLPANDPAHTHHLYTIRVPAERRNELVAHLLAAGISAGVHYKPIYYYPPWERKRPLPVTDDEWLRLVSLPIFYDLKDSQVWFIAEQVKNAAVQW